MAQPERASEERRVSDADTVRAALEWTTPPRDVKHSALAALARLEAAEANADSARQEAHRLSETIFDLTERLEQAEVDTERKVDAHLRARLIAAEAQRDALAEALRELSECVLNGWTSPAFVRGRLHERAVEIARAHVEPRVPTEGRAR